MKLDSKTLPPQFYFFDLTLENKIITLGSCFSDNIGTNLTDLKFNVFQNPFGTLYHPLVIAQIINDAMMEVKSSNQFFIENDGLWRWWLGHGSLAHPDLDFLKSSIENIKSELKSSLQAVNTVLFLTFGSSYSYTFLEQNLMVGNCHKIPDKYFSKHISSVADISKAYFELISALIKVNPSLKIVFTVSPVRHIKDGLHENNLSKSTLLLAVDEIVSRFSENCCYFPAYELQIDGLRDYQYYNDDLVHPSSKAVAFIWERFCASFFNGEMIQWRKEFENLSRSLHHRPLHPSSVSFQVFVRKLSASLADLSSSYPLLDWSSEEQKLNQLMEMLPNQSK